MNKYFELSGTISGTNYFLRNLLSTLLAFLGGYSIGFGIGSEQNLLFMIGIVILLPTLWFNICTIYKRSLALFPEQAVIITLSLLAFQFLGEVYPFFHLFSLVIGLTLLFKNSNIEKHEG
jgi:uncharacterized membrane protein YhaH (DUF805 family)